MKKGTELRYIAHYNLHVLKIHIYKPIIPQALREYHINSKIILIRSVAHGRRSKEWIWEIRIKEMKYKNT